MNDAPAGARMTVLLNDHEFDNTDTQTATVNLNI